jgi:hypothetical protein
LTLNSILVSSLYKGGTRMINFFTDLILLAIFIIGLTAFLGIITHGISAKLFGRNTYLQFDNKSKQIQNGWRKV